MMSTAKTEQTMICGTCNVRCQRFGSHRNGLRRFRCPQCKRTYTEPHTRTLDAMYIPEEKAVLVTRLLLEGNSIRSSERISGIDRTTIARLLVLAGERCEKLLADTITKLRVRDVEADEMWGFVGMKEKAKGNLYKERGYAWRRLHLRCVKTQLKTDPGVASRKAEPSRHLGIHPETTQRDGRKIPTNNGRLAFISRCG